MSWAIKAAWYQLVAKISPLTKVHLKYFKECQNIFFYIITRQENNYLFFLQHQDSNFNMHLLMQQIIYIPYNMKPLHTGCIAQLGTPTPFQKGVYL